MIRLALDRLEIYKKPYAASFTLKNSNSRAMLGTPRPLSLKMTRRLTKTPYKLGESWNGQTLKCCKTVATPKPGPTRMTSSNLNPRTLVILFLFTFYFVLFFKSVATRIPGLTRRADPNQSSVYSDVFNYLIKTFSLCYFSLGFRFARKHFQMVGPQTFTFHKMKLQ